MKKMVLALLGFTLSFLSFAQSNCKYDYDKYDKMEKQRNVWNVEKVSGGLGAKWWLKMADFGGAKCLIVTVRLGTLSGMVVGTSDPVKLKFTDSDSIFSAYPKRITSSYIYANVCDEIAVTYYLDAGTAEKLSTTDLDNIRIYFNNNYRDASIKKGEAERIQKSANCVYQQL